MGMPVQWKAKGQQVFLPSMRWYLIYELALRRTEGMAEVKTSIHVRVGESQEVLVLAWLRVSFIEAEFTPRALCLSFMFYQEVSALGWLLYFH
jgi:hypothetical protein